MNVETNLASADREIMSHYAGLVGNEARARRIPRPDHGGIRADARDACGVLRPLHDGPPAPRREDPRVCAPTRCACCTDQQIGLLEPLARFAEGRRRTGRQADAAGVAAFHQRHRQRPADDGVIWSVAAWHDADFPGATCRPSCRRRRRVAGIRSGVMTPHSELCLPRHPARYVPRVWRGRQWRIRRGSVAPAPSPANPRPRRACRIPLLVQVVGESSPGRRTRGRPVP